MAGPLATFTVNFLGCFLMGFLSEIDFKSASYLHYFLLVGVLGGFTTFSAFGLDTMTFIKTAAPFKAFLYVSATLLVCLISVFLGAFSYKVFN